MREIVLGQVICNGVSLGIIQPFEVCPGRGRGAGVMEGSTAVTPVSLSPTDVADKRGRGESGEDLNGQKGQGRYLPQCPSVRRAFLVGGLRVVWFKGRHGKSDIT